MEEKTIDQSPTIADNIVFDIQTPDADDCMTANPYKVSTVTIYYVQRSFSSENFGEATVSLYDQTLEAKLATAQAAACASPTPENIAAVKDLQAQVDLSAVRNEIRYNDAVPVMVYGSDDYPAWLSTDSREGGNVVGESIAIAATGTPYILTYDNVASVVVWNSTKTARYTENTDYTVDYDAGSITAVGGGGITPPTTVYVDYGYLPGHQKIEQAKDEDGNPIPCNFRVHWQPTGMREGDYFICWTWSPVPAGAELTAHQYFGLLGDTQLTTSTPTHQTDPDKYPTLLDRYLPEMFKDHICSSDLTPEVIQEFNMSVAKGFTFLEDMANQIVDLVDSNAVPESMLTYLANCYNLKLRSSDPTMWRRQIKRAIPVFKKKGTYDGLSEALAQAGVQLTKFTRLWQIVSPSTYQEAFVAEDGQTQFSLSRVAVLVPFDNTEIYFRGVGDDSWTQVMTGTFTTTTFTWTGSALVAGDEVRVIYKIAAVPNQTLEDYIRSLPLADQRDERDQSSPVKNWNVRVIEEDDPLFAVLIPDRNPYHDSVIFGHVRTEFPYSENIYNMEEYNGSIRESTDPCDIDKTFVDPCSACASSKYNLDLAIENLSDDRIKEAREIIKEYTPFHAVLHTMNLVGSFDEIVQPPVENLETLITFAGNEMTIADPPQLIFNRWMQDQAVPVVGEQITAILNTPVSLEHNKVNVVRVLSANRDQMYTEGVDFTVNNAAGSVTALSTGSIAGGESLVVDYDHSSFTREDVATFTSLHSGTGTGSSDKIVFYCPTLRLDDIPALETTYSELKVFSPSPNAGTYTLNSPDGNIADVTSAVTEPLNQSAFTFRLSTKVAYKSSGVSITQIDTHTISDTSLDYLLLNIVSRWDVQNNPAITSPWIVEIASVQYPVEKMNADGTLVLEGSPPVGSGTTYAIKTDLGVTVASSTTGVVSVSHTGLIDLGSGTIDVYDQTANVADITDMESFIKLGYYAVYHGSSDTTQYKIINFGDGPKFYIENYTGGNASGHDVRIYNRNVDSDTGYFRYSGMTLDTGGYTIPINPATDGSKDDNTFKDNFLVHIGSYYYAIASASGSTVALNGPPLTWPTTGTSVSYTVYKAVRNPIDVPERKLYSDSFYLSDAMVDYKGMGVGYGWTLVVDLNEYPVENLEYSGEIKVTDDGTLPVSTRITGEIIQAKRGEIVYLNNAMVSDVQVWNDTRTTLYTVNLDYVVDKANGGIKVLGAAISENQILKVDYSPDIIPLAAYSLKNPDGSVVEMPGAGRVSGSGRLRVVRSPIWPGNYFEQGVDRRGNETYEVDTETKPVSMALMSRVLNSGKDGIKDVVSQSESISFTIEYKRNT